MIQPASMTADQDTQRRQVLAKVYSLLIRLAEEAEQPATDSLIANKEKNEKPTLIQLELLKPNIPS